MWAEFLKHALLFTTRLRMNGSAKRKQKAMADEEENEPLLVNSQPNAVEISVPRQRIRNSRHEDQLFAQHNSCYLRENGALAVSSSTQSLGEPDQVVAVFVVAFDTKAGTLSSRVVM